MGGVAILERNDIKFDITDTWSTINTDNEAITILLKDSQDLISISTIYVSPASTTNTTLLNNIKNSPDNIIITGDTNFKTDKWGVLLKRDLCNADLFITGNSKPTDRDSRTNTSNTIDYLISSPTNFNNI